LKGLDTARRCVMRYHGNMSSLVDRLSISWLKNPLAPTPPPALQETYTKSLAAAIRQTLAGMPQQQGTVQAISKALGPEIKFSSVLPVVEEMAAAKSLQYLREDPDTGNHLVQLRP
jgi:hypothetical protein